MTSKRIRELALEVNRIISELERERPGFVEFFGKGDEVTQLWPKLNTGFSRVREDLGLARENLHWLADVSENLEKTGKL